MKKTKVITINTVLPVILLLAMPVNLLACYKSNDKKPVALSLKQLIAKKLVTKLKHGFILKFQNGKIKKFEGSQYSYDHLYGLDNSGCYFRTSTSEEGNTSLTTTFYNVKDASETSFQAIVTQSPGGRYILTVETEDMVVSRDFEKRNYYILNLYTVDENSIVKKSEFRTAKLFWTVYQKQLAHPISGKWLSDSVFGLYIQPNSHSFEIRDDNIKYAEIYLDGGQWKYRQTVESDQVKRLIIKANPNFAR